MVLRYPAANGGVPPERMFYFTLPTGDFKSIGNLTSKQCGDSGIGGFCTWTRAERKPFNEREQLTVIYIVDKEL